MYHGNWIARHCYSTTGDLYSLCQVHPNNLMMNQDLWWFANTVTVNVMSSIHDRIRSIALDGVVDHRFHLPPGFAVSISANVLDSTALITFATCSLSSSWIKQWQSWISTLLDMIAGTSVDYQTSSSSTREKTNEKRTHPNMTVVYMYVMSNRLNKNLI